MLRPVTTDRPWITSPPTVTVQTLPNGLTVLAAPLHHARTAAFCLNVRVGSRDDPPGREGLAHILEHMLFRGTERLPSARALNAAIEALGTSMYAATTRSYTTFEMTTPPETLGPALELLGELITTPTLAELDVERDIVLQERLDEVDERGRPIDLDNVSMRALWPSSGLGHSIVGSERSLRAITRDDLAAHLARYYGAPNLVLAVVGPYDSASLHALAARAMSALPATEAPARAPVQRRGGLPAVELTQHVGSQVELDLTFAVTVAPDADADAGPNSAEAGEGLNDRDAVWLLSRLLDEGAASRLRARLCDDLGLTYEIGVDGEAYIDAAMLRVSGAVEPKRVARLADEVVAILRDSMETPPTEAELGRLKLGLRLSLLASLESPESFAAWLAGRARRGHYRPIEEVAARLQALRGDELVAAARRLMRPENAQLTAIGPTRGMRHDLQRALRGLQ
jgi:predicted Zn-dependent peptidase